MVRRLLTFLGNVSVIVATMIATELRMLTAWLVRHREQLAMDHRLMTVWLVHKLRRLLTLLGNVCVTVVTTIATELPMSTAWLVWLREQLAMDYCLLTVWLVLMVRRLLTLLGNVCVTVVTTIAMEPPMSTAWLVRHREQLAVDYCLLTVWLV